MALPAYDQCIKASHVFNLLDARGVISVTERQSYIMRVRELAKACGEAWMKTEAGGAVEQSDLEIEIFQRARIYSPPSAREARGGEGSGVGGACHRERSVRSTAAFPALARCVVTRLKPKRSFGNISANLHSSRITFCVRRRSVRTSPISPVTSSGSSSRSMAVSIPIAASDEARTRYLEANGYRVLRFWNNECL